MPFNLSLFTLGMMIMSNNKSFQIKKLITPGIIASLIAVLIKAIVYQIMIVIEENQ